MKAAVMQPYFMPYIGYFELVRSVDTFVFFDDVNFIKRGWINRNNILVDGRAKMFTIPLHKASQNKKINKTYLFGEEWKHDLLKLIEYAYRKSPYFDKFYPVIYEIIHSDNKLISNLAEFSIKAVADYIGLNTNFISSSEVLVENDLRGEDRIIALCKALGVQEYVNLPGGKSLYDRNKFKLKGIGLKFVKPRTFSYKQFNDVFVPQLSIIDILMFNDIDQVAEHIKAYEIE